MNKHTRLVASLLFAVIIILAAAITRFYLSVPDNIVNKSSQTEIVRRLGTDSSGNFIFSDGSGKYGVADREERIIVAAEWQELDFTDAGRLIASQKIGGRSLYGCIDYEGNAVVPFIYRSIKRAGTDRYPLYIAEYGSDGSCVVYDGGFIPCFRRVWSSCEADDGEIVLTDESGAFTYDVSADGLLFKRASVAGETMGCGYSLDIYSRVLLSKLDADMIEKMTYSAGKYAEFAFTGDDELLSEITTGSRSGFIQLFPDDHRLLSKKLIDMTDLHIYSVKSESGEQRYETVFTAKTELTYTDENGARQTMQESCKASVMFTGSSGSDIMAVSGSFEKDSPDYPEPENETPELSGAENVFPAAESDENKTDQPFMRQNGE